MKFALLVFTLVLSGCAGMKCDDSPKDLLWHNVSVPARYRSGDPWPGYDGESKRYTYAYEQAWWRCVATYAKDIDHKTDIADRAGNGWPCAVDGCSDGYSDCEIRVQQIIKRLGREAAQKVFQKALNAPEE